jgi:broad specificity polyphosphatase/5'/3'-nucleotidase SurE
VLLDLLLTGCLQRRLWLLLLHNARLLLLHNAHLLLLLLLCTACPDLVLGGHHPDQPTLNISSLATAAAAAAAAVESTSSGQAATAASKIRTQESQHSSRAKPHRHKLQTDAG